MNNGPLLLDLEEHDLIQDHVGEGFGGSEAHSGRKQTKVCGRPGHSWPDGKGVAFISFISFQFWIFVPDADLKQKPWPRYNGSMHRCFMLSLSQSIPELLNSLRVEVSLSHLLLLWYQGSIPRETPFAHLLVSFLSVCGLQKTSHLLHLNTLDIVWLKSAMCLQILLNLLLHVLWNGREPLFPHRWKGDNATCLAGEN